MKIAKITGPATYHRCIKDLNEYGYINYIPKKTETRKASFIFWFESGSVIFWAEKIRSIFYTYLVI